MAYIYCNKEQRDIISAIKRKLVQEKLNRKDDSKTTDADVVELLIKKSKIVE